MRRPNPHSHLVSGPQIKRLAADRAELLAALERMVAMHDTMMAKTNHGASFYDADCIREMNEAPSQARALIARLSEPRNLT